MAGGGGDASDEAIGRAADAWHARMLEPGSEAEVDAFEAWLAEDPAHARAYAVAEANSALAKRLPRRLLAPAATRTRFLGFSPAFSVIAAILLATAGVLWLTGGAPSAAEAAIANPGPGTRDVRLSDGSDVLLDAGASVHVVVGRGQRQASLSSGRVRFTIAPDANTNFSVQAPGVLIEAGPAVFDVTISSGAVEVHVLRGTVSVTATSDGGAPLALRGSQAVSVRGSEMRRFLVDPERSRWPVSRVSFAGTPLAEVIQLANREARRPLVLAEPSLGSLRVSGVLDLRDSTRLARKLGAALDLDVDNRPEAIVLRR